MIGVAFYGIVIIAILAMRGEATWNVPGAGMDAGLWAGVMLGTVIWATDTGAFFTGRQVGGEKLAPDISPSKTWSGAIGGFGLGTLAGLVLWLLIVPASPWWIGLALSAAISILGQAGDLTESAIKRRFRVKDFGRHHPRAWRFDGSAGQPDLWRPLPFCGRQSSLGIRRRRRRVPPLVAIGRPWPGIAMLTQSAPN